MAATLPPASKTIPPSSSPAFASPSDWELARPFIAHLYIDEDKTLKDVMNIMDREHGHRGTIKMYKTRIEQWGLRKNNKEAEARAILGMKRQRDAVGKVSAFRVRGKQVNIGDVMRYIRRKGGLDVETQLSGCVPTQGGIECWTPLPSPSLSASCHYVSTQERRKLDLDNLGSSKEQSSLDFCRTAVGDTTWAAASIIDRNFADATGDTAEVCQGLQTSSILSWTDDITKANSQDDQLRRILFPKLESSVEVPRSPLPPEQFLVPEKLFVNIKTYYSGAIDGQMYTTDDSGSLVNVNFAGSGESLNTFTGLCAKAAELMATQSFIEGRKCLSKACDLVKSIVLEQNPGALHCFLETLIYHERQGYAEVVTVLRNLVCRMAAMMFAETHPWRQILAQIGAINSLHVVAITTEAHKCIGDILADRLGQFHKSVILCYTDTILLHHPSSHGVKLLYDFLKLGEKELPASDPRILELQYAYGSSLYIQRRYSEAVAIIDEIVVRCQETGGHGELEIISLQLSAYCYYKLNQEEYAEARLRDAMGRYERMYDNADIGITLDLKTVLERWLRQWGWDCEADDIKAEIDEIIGLDEIDVL